MSKKFSKLFLLRIFFGSLFLMCIGYIWYSGFYKYLSFEQMKAHSFWLHKQVYFHYWNMVFLYLITYTAIIVCCLPGAGFMSIIGGFLFGFFKGLLYIMIGANIGAFSSFLIVRYLVGEYVQNKYKIKLQNINTRIEKRGWYYLVLIRCIPLVPFFIVNVAIGLTRIRLFTFLWTTIIGIIPTSVIFAYTGKQLATILKLEDILSWQMLFAFIVLVLIVLIPTLIAQRYKIF